ncbi:hypothetical protein E4T66_13650 [Sinimarinibacterium sp. CAU 1509]|uniref:hypothetical protein n=1 Tax=Sinimarinibacterium sp. CAU 1509 TaxID=2562283 RepID=UPI0010AC4096|nr:hypothetical protein [Sinimarinibacterium sp. CAU 1509]TJY59429.1 hypothetical protein E4T66_13650 [Sinimarinibacterium sp. CAU 1509]
MSEQSAAIVDFIAKLMPLYDGEDHERVWCARSLEDGTLLLPQPGGEDDDPDNDFIRVRWQGVPEREQVVSGSDIATLAVVRYVEFHGVGRPAKDVAAELAHLSQHFTFKTGCSLYLPYEPTGPDLVSAVRKAVSRMGESAVVNLLTKTAGF